MKKYRKILYLMGFMLSAALAQKMDDATGLILDEGVQMVKDKCISCHSAKLITQNRGTEKDWLESIRRMQRELGMQQLDEKIEKQIVKYLAKNYAPPRIYRRPPLPKHLMP